MSIVRTFLRLVAISVLIIVSLQAATAQCDCAPPMPDSCNLTKDDTVVFTGKVIRASNEQYRFQVEEDFKGAPAKHIDLEGWNSCTYRNFKLGKEYLVFAGPDIDGKLSAGKCSGKTRPIEWSQALLEQLQGGKAGKRTASLFGVLWQTMDGDVWDEKFNHPMPNTVIRLKSGKKTFQTITDAHGAYAFERLPKGIYQASADLPPHLKIGQIILKDPVPPFELPARSCFDNDMYAFPRGVFQGVFLVLTELSRLIWVFPLTCTALISMGNSAPGLLRIATHLLFLAFPRANMFCCSMKPLTLDLPRRSIQMHRILSTRNTYIWLPAKS